MVAQFVASHNSSYFQEYFVLDKFKANMENGGINAILSNFMKRLIFRQ